MFKLSKYRYLWFLMAVLGLSLTSCVDDNFSIDEKEGNNPELEEGMAISFKILLSKDLASRDGEITRWNGDNKEYGNAEGYDNIIDTQDKFRVFFFTKEGDFLFGAIDRTISDGSSSGVNAVYTVRVPMNVIVDRQGNEYPIEQIKSYLKNNDFKVAVLANWPNEGKKINPGDYDDGDNTGNFGENPASTLKGHPLWGLKNSVVYKYNYDLADDAGKEDMRARVGVPEVKNINDLHHLFDETNVYAAEVETEERASNKECFSPFMAKNDDDKWAMGEPTDWVKMRSVDDGWHANYARQYVMDFDSKETANIWIRANWSPDKDLNNAKAIYRHYQHLWYLWNFDASYKYGLFKTNSSANGAYASAYQSNFGWNNGFTQGVTNKWGEQWYDRNGRDIYNWMNGTSSANPLNSLRIVTGIEGMNDSFFTFNNFPNAEACYMVKNDDAINNNRTYYGVRLPSRGTSIAENTSPGTFVFQARTSGTLRIKWGNGNANQNATLVIQKGTEVLKKYSVSSGNRYKLYDLGGTSDPGETFLDIENDASSAPIYIYCSEGAAVIYAIEYIRGKYLYETDREGVIPDADQGIPMYGVQNFKKLSNWTEGSTAYISTDQKLEVKLIRALAKVVVYIPEALGKPRHIYMRNMNRAARCEPMNVENPITWRDEENNGQHSSKCEFFNLKKYGPTYDPLKGGKNAQEYRNWLSWFYGSWGSASWKTTGEYEINEEGEWTPTSNNPINTSEASWKFEGATVPTNGERDEEDNLIYPEIFNPYITRSDFCHFIYMGRDEKNDNKHKYVLYMPDKFIDDPVHTGNFSSAPAVPHIEFRFDPGTDMSDKANKLTHSEFNLDDDRCFRIYFTNYNEDENGKENPEIRNVLTGSSFANYEKNRDNLKYHWPIMRNHTYEFHVNSAAPDRLLVNVTISDWSHEKVVAEW